MLGIIWGMNVPLKVLSIVGMVLLAALALFLAVLLLLAFFPFTYRVSGSKDAEGLKLSVKVNWLFGLFRVRFRYPEPGHLTARALWFTLFDCKIPPEIGGEGDEPAEKDLGKKLSGLLEKSKSGKDRKARKHRPAGEDGKEDDRKHRKQRRAEAREHGGAEEDRAQGGGGHQGAEDSADQSGSSNGAGGADSASALEGASGADSAGASNGAGASEGTDKGSGEGSAREDASGGTENETSENAGNPDSGGASEASQESSGKFFRKIQKIKYTICNIYDKIKKIWKNISYYIELLQEENTKQLAAHALERGRKVLKSVGPKHVKGELVFGTGSPDTTGYLYGGYCVVASLFGTGFWVTPDFEQKRLEGEFDVSGHVILWVLAINGLKLLFDRKLRVFLRGLKAAQKKASA